MKTLPLTKRPLVLLIGALMFGASAAALADPPSRVARLATIDGPVSFAPAGDDSWVYASRNRPLISGDRLWTDPSGRDEVQVGSAALRMDGGTLLTLLNLDDNRTQVQLSQGRLNVRVRWMAPGEVVEIDTPNAALAIRAPGTYRVEVDPNGEATMVAVRSGQVDAYGQGNAYRLDPGQAIRFFGTDLRDMQYAQAPWDDDFDRWSAARDERFARARTARYVPRDLIGYEDLDDNGSWRSVPDYGNVWVPANVASDWAPYRDGHWSWVQPWGWTWIDDAPWGFAVSHYGRWARLDRGWCWVPGPRTVRPVYAPALVAFVNIGGTPTWRRDTPVGWFPLAPREVYRPSYRASPTYITNINVTNTTINRTQVVNVINRNVTNVTYVNRQAGGMTAMPAAAFVEARPVSKARLAVPAAAVATAAVAGAMTLAPQHASLVGGAGAGHAPPPQAMARPALVKTAPLHHAPMPVTMAQEGARPAPPPKLTVLADRGHGFKPQPVPPPLHGAPTPIAGAVPGHAPAPVPQPGTPMAGVTPPGLRHAPIPVQPPQPGTSAPAEVAPGLKHGPTPVPPQPGTPTPMAAVAPSGLKHGPTPVPPQAGTPTPMAGVAPASPPGLRHGPTPVPQIAAQRGEDAPKPPASMPPPSLHHAPQMAAAPSRPESAPAPQMAAPAPRSEPMRHAPTPVAAQPPRPEPPMQHAPMPAPQPPKPAPQIVAQAPQPPAPRHEAPPPPQRQEALPPPPQRHEAPPPQREAPPPPQQHHEAPPPPPPQRHEAPPPPPAPRHEAPPPPPPPALHHAPVPVSAPPHPQGKPEHGPAKREDEKH